jgi:LysM repeat protein
MNNQNPFVPQGSLLELQGKRRSRMKLAVFCVLAVCVTGLMAMLIQGCKRETESAATDTTTATTDTNLPVIDTNPPPTEVSNPPVTVPPAVVAPTPEPEVASSEYVVVAHDTFAKIAKAHGVSVKALEAANPNVQPTKLKIGKKLVLPSATVGAAAPSPSAVSTGMGGDAQVYTVKSGDTLGHLAKTFGTTVKTIQAENNLTTTSIKVGQKLKIPAKAEAAAPVPAPADTATAPPVPPVTAAPPAAPSK